MYSNLKEIMKEKKTTIRELTQTTGLALQTIMNARDSKKILSCSLQTLLTIAAALDVPVKDLFSDEDGPNMD